MQRAARQEPPPPPPPPPQEEDYPSPVHPLHRYASPHAAPEADYDAAPQFADADHERDLSRYDDALYGELDTAAADPQHDPAYAEDAYGYQDGYDGGEDEVPKRRGGMITVGVVLALAVLGNGRSLCLSHLYGIGSHRRAADHQADAGRPRSSRLPPMAAPNCPIACPAVTAPRRSFRREEAPVDVNARSAPRVVFPPLNQNGTPPSTASATPGAPPPIPEMARCPTMSPERSGPSRSAAIRPTLRRPR